VWIKTEGFGKLNRSMFIVKAVGKSMEPLIPDGSLCVFRANVVGSRNNKIVLVQHSDYFDAENEGSYSNEYSPPQAAGYLKKIDSYICPKGRGIYPKRLKNIPVKRRIIRRLANGFMSRLY